MSCIVKISKLPHGVGLELPRYATEDSAGMDLPAALEEDVILKPFQRILIGTGISIELPKNFEAQIRPRSGLAYKNGITVLNTPGPIDADYRGEIKVLLINLGTEDFIIGRGMRIAQLVIAPVVQATLSEVLEFEETARGAGGFGSTGVSG